ncbi:internal virion protein C [Aeromonas phage vB_AspA_Lolek]|nr:internal virion protein C [Aeromonas phage vB_AspA_Lolek]
MELIDKNAAISLNPEVVEASPKSTMAAPAVSPKTLYAAPVAESVEVEMSPEATFAEGLVAGARQTLAKALWDTLETPEFEVQPGYNPEQRYRHDVQAFGVQFAPDEQDYLLSAISDEEYTHRLQVTVNKQQDMATMVEAPVGAFAGSVVDVDLFLGLGIGKVATTAAKAAKISRAVAAAGGAASGAIISGGLSASTVEATDRDTAMIVGDIIAGGVGGLFGGLSAVPKFKPSPLTAKGAGAAAEVDSKVGGSMSKYLSAYDRLASYIGKEDADKILANPMDDIGDSAVAYGRNAKLDGDRRLAEYEKAVQGIVGKGLTLNPKARAAIRTQRLELEHDMMKLMNTNRQREINGLPPLTSPNANVQAMADAYVKSGYAQEMLKKMKAAGVYGAEDIDASAFYIPVRHNYTKMAAAVQQGATSWESLRVMYGSQIAKMYPGLTDLGLTPSTIGGHFIETQKGSAAIGGIRGVLKEELRHMLVNAGVSKDKIENLLTDLYKKTEDAGKASNLRRRMDWNFDKVHIDGQGRSISMNDFLDTDVTSVMQRYNRTMSGRIGLAQAGYTSEASLKEVLMKARDKFAGSPEGIQGYDKFMDDIQNSLLGRPTGEQLPEWLRAGNSVGAMMQLANSGLYNLVDYANIAHNFGIQAVAKHFIKSLKGSGIGAVTAKEAETVQQVITGRLVAEGRMRDVVTHLEDNFEAPVGGLYEATSYAGQSTRFLNGSEYVRRHQVNMVAGILDDLTTKLAAGDRDAAAFFIKQRIPPERIAAIKAQVSKYGPVLEEWDDYATKEYYTTQMISATDNIAVMVRNGEVPAMMTHSIVGKMLFPYMNFTFAMTQKLLRREYTRNGATGVAALMVAQAPLATLSAAMINISGGREWDADLAVRAVKALPIMGVGGVGFDALTRGELGGAAPIFGVFNQAAGTVSSAASGNLDASTVLKTIPGASVFVPARMVVSLIDSENK